MGVVEMEDSWWMNRKEDIKEDSAYIKKIKE